MGFLKKLFTGKEDTKEEKEEKDFDILKYDGIKAVSSCMCNIDYAISCFEHALNIKEDSETRVYLAKAYSAKGHLEKAAEQYSVLQENEPNEPLHAIRLAQVAFQLENYDLMENACKTALNIDNTLAMPHHLLAMKAKAQGNIMNAIAESTQAIASKEDFYDAYMLRAQVLYNIQQFQEAEKDINFILEHTEPTEETSLLKADISTALGKTEEAKSLYKGIIDYNPFEVKAYIGLCSVLMSDKNLTEAKNIIHEGLEQMPESSELYKTLGGIKYIEGDKIGAAEDLKKALELDPEEAEKLSGEYTNYKEKMLEAYNTINPYNLGVKI